MVPSESIVYPPGQVASLELCTYQDLNWMQNNILITIIMRPILIWTKMMMVRIFKMMMVIKVMMRMVKMKMKDLQVHSAEFQ